MGRPLRLQLPHRVHLVSGWSVGETPAFQEDDDFRYFLEALKHLLRENRISLHGYIVLPHRYHLLLTPEDEQSITKLMRVLPKRYTDYHLKKYQHPHAVWQGRYRCAIVQNDTDTLELMLYLDYLACHIAGAPSPNAYRWSSCAHYTGEAAQTLLSPPPLIWHLANTPFARQRAYQTLLDQTHAIEKQKVFERAMKFGGIIGEASFIEDLERSLGRRLQPGKAGRPKNLTGTNLCAA